jgi:hypothetical protein
MIEEVKGENQQVDEEGPEIFRPGGKLLAENLGENLFPLQNHQPDSGEGHQTEEAGDFIRPFHKKNRSHSGVQPPS